MVRLFVNGRSFASDKLSDSTARLTMAFGKLNMDAEVLLDNAKAIVDAVSTSKPSHVGPPIISKISIICPPSIETFQIHDSQIPASLRIVTPMEPAAAGAGKKAAPGAAVAEEGEDEDESDDEKTSTHVKVAKS